MYMKKYFEKIGQVNTFFHHRDFKIDNSVIRMNLDTLYSLAIIDLKDGPVSIILPQIDDRYFSCNVLDEMHYESLKIRGGIETEKGATNPALGKNLILFSFCFESKQHRCFVDLKIICLFQIKIKYDTH